MMTRASLIEWAASWVPETSPLGEPGQRERFAKALADELKDWREPEQKPIYCRHCPHAKHVHEPDGGPCGCGACPGFEPGMRLVDLKPRWAADADIVIGGVSRHFEGRHGMAVSFECPCCFDAAAGHSRARLAVWFANPVDGLPPTDDAERLWQRVAGTTFDDLSLSPSIDASKFGHWHGFITNGEIR